MCDVHFTWLSLKQADKTRKEKNWKQNYLALI